MRVTDAWLIYVLIVLGVFILLSFCGTSSAFDVPTKLFFAFLVGVIVILILIPGIVAVPEDRTWYSLLLIFSFLVPLLLAVWMIWTQRWSHLSNHLSRSYAETGTGSANAGMTVEHECEGDVCRVSRVIEGNNVYNY
jgi:uncharacterized membrane protein